MYCFGRQQIYGRLGYVVRRNPFNNYSLLIERVVFVEPKIVNVFFIVTLKTFLLIMKTSVKIKDVDKKYNLFFKNKFFYLIILDYFLLLYYDVQYKIKSQPNLQEKDVFIFHIIFVHKRIEASYKIT